MKRGQSAFEFLITYGWVFVIGLTTVFYLSSFGFLGGEKFLPDVCSIDSGFLCQESVLYTYDDVGNNPLYEGAGLIGLNIQNKNSKKVEHAYLVIDPEDSYCGGYFGIIASPLTDRVNGPMEVGESRLVKFQWLDKLCGPGPTFDCSASGGGDCLQAHNICSNRAGDCVEENLGEGDWYCEDYNTGCPPGDCENLQGYVCVENPEEIPIKRGDKCYIFPSISTMNYIPCTCADKLTYCDDIETTFNCCDSTFAFGTNEVLSPNYQEDLLTYGQGFCPGYTIGNDNICDGEPMNEIDYYTVDFSIIYKYTDSDLFHKTQGYFKLKNSGPISNI
ncbi:MAG: hypothetical protein Q8Q42_00170 [Nanoarchaeota archaeon]|nr:hypothetical protein [Nanoarchaeota archaeon]